MIYWLSQLLNGLSFGMLLYFLAAGLTLTLGVMRVTNLTHGSFYLVGAYVALDVVRGTGSFPLGALAAALAMAVVGAVVFGLLRITGSDPLRQTLLTFGLVFIIADLSLLAWGGDPVTVGKPSYLLGPANILGFRYPAYRLFIIVFGLLVAAILEVLQRRTLIGAMVRAVVDDVEMAGGVGLNARLIGAATFLTGAALAGLSGALGGAMIGVFPGADIQVLLLGTGRRHHRRHGQFDRIVGQRARRRASGHRRAGAVPRDRRLLHVPADAGDADRPSVRTVRAQMRSRRATGWGIAGVALLLAALAPLLLSAFQPDDRDHGPGFRDLRGQPEHHPGPRRASQPRPRRVLRHRGLCRRPAAPVRDATASSRVCW